MTLKFELGLDFYLATLCCRGIPMLSPCVCLTACQSARLSITREYCVKTAKLGSHI